MNDSFLGTQDINDFSQTKNGYNSREESAWGILLPMSNYYPCIKLMEDNYQVGRLAQIILNGNIPYFNSISKIHFEIIKEDDNIFIKDRSANGTFIDDIKIGNGNKRALATDQVISLSLASNKAFLFRNFNTLEPAPPREVAEKYTISKKLGSGAYGEVKLAFNNITNVAYAVKIIPKRKLSKIKPSQSIESEVAIMKKLTHPCIVHLEETIETDDNVYIFLELVPGGELFQRVEIKEFTEEEAKALFYQMVLAIKYLHENNIVHRDLKPENILMVSTEQNMTLIKITDFGMSKFLDGQTMLKTMCGTPNYLAPEIILHSGLEPYSSACDVWSLGVILFICLVGYPPFCEDREDYTLKEQILGGKLEYSRCFWKNISEDAKNLVQSMITVDVNKRITLDQILEHAWISNDEDMKEKVHNLMYPDQKVKKDTKNSEDEQPPVKKKKLN